MSWTLRAPTSSAFWSTAQAGMRENGRGARGPSLEWGAAMQPPALLGMARNGALHQGMVISPARVAKRWRSACWPNEALCRMPM